VNDVVHTAGRSTCGSARSDEQAAQARTPANTPTIGLVLKSFRITLRLGKSGRRHNPISALDRYP
jgi:hypothetical protein